MLTDSPYHYPWLPERFLAGGAGHLVDFERKEAAMPKNAKRQAPQMQEMTVRLERYFCAFVEDMVASGRFSSPGQVIRAGLRLLEETESREAALAAALQEGEESGWVEDFDFDEFLARKNAEFLERERGEKV
jgi:antitoxin ParD1/3/4